MGKSEMGHLTITAGGGSGYVIDGAAVARHRGHIADVLRTILDEEVRDPDLLAMLADPQLALEMYDRDERGEPHEAPLGPTEDWQRVVDELQREDKVLHMSRSAEGGGGDETAAGDPRGRFPYQQAVRHGRSYALTDADRREAQAGRAVFITGEALAKAEVICREADASEVFWWWLSGPDGPLIVDVLVPEQSASSGFCRVEGPDVSKAARAAFGQGRRIVAAGHSHGWSGLFSSRIDKDQMKELVREAVGLVENSRRSVAGKVRRAGGADGDDGHLAVTFGADQPGINIRIADADGAAPQEPKVELDLDSRCVTSTFSTHNRYGTHFFPALRTVRCPSCGIKRLTFIDAGEVVVHVVGPIRLGAEERRQLAEQVRGRVRGRQLAVAWRADEAAEQRPDVPDRQAAADGEGDGQPDGPPADFQLYRRDRPIADIPAVLLEEAAANTPKLSVVLGWTPAGTQADEEITHA